MHLLLLPGLLNDARLWQHQLTNLADVADASVGDLTGADTIAEIASTVLANAPARFALAGLSMGGYVALEILRRAPDRVLGLALLSTNARPDSPESTQNRRRLMQLAEKDFGAVIDTLLPKMVHPSHLTNRAVADVFNAMAHSVGKEAFHRQQLAIIGRPDSRPSLPNIKCPTLVICGKDDVVTPIAMHEEMATVIPNARLTVIDNCGHLCALEQPQQVTTALNAWLLTL